MADNLLDKASILLTPTAYNDGSMLSVKPENGDGDFDFTRGSAATRVNAQGLVENVQIISSELVSNGNFSQGSQDWSLGNKWSIGENSAIRVPNSTSNLSQVISGISGKTIKVSYEVSNYVAGDIGASADGNNYNANNGNGTFVDYITPDSDNLYIRGSYSFEGSISNISVKEITDDTNIPRIDYTDGCGSWLLEPQSTNLITYSEDFSNAAWTKNGGATVENSYSSPDGGSNAYKINLINSSSQVGTTAISLDTSKEYTFSVWLRTESGTLNVDLGNVQSGIYETVNVTDEWVRYNITQTPSATTRYPNIDYNQSGSVLAWGAQLEQQSYATSYIPTQGAISTRLADAAGGSGNSTLINSTEGVLYLEIAKADVNANEGGVYLSKDSNNEIRLNFATNNRLNLFVNVGGVNQVYMDNASFTLSDYNKIAIKYKINDYSVYINGTKVYTDTSALVPSNLDELKFNNFYGNTKALAVFKEALTDAELQSLTTI